jgi:hypothetical protein
MCGMCDGCGLYGSEWIAVPSRVVNLSVKVARSDLWNGGNVVDYDGVSKAQITPLTSSGS